MNFFKQLMLNLIIMIGVLHATTTVYEHINNSGYKLDKVINTIVQDSKQLNDIQLQSTLNIPNHKENLKMHITENSTSIISSIKKSIIEFFNKIANLFSSHRDTTSNTASNTIPNTTSNLKVHITKNTTGINISSIKKGSIEFLNQRVELFDLYIQNVDTKSENKIGANSGWRNVNVSTNGVNQIITLSSPIDKRLPTTLKATITISTKNNQSKWGLSVKGLGKHFSLMEIAFPKFNIKSDGNDNFFLPYHFGRVVPNPSKHINFSGINGLYPRGWGATMQYLAYYNNKYGLYFGFHDPKATLKRFSVHNSNGGVLLSGHIIAPNKTIAGNDWNMSGLFELDSYKGDWYEASQIYKKWVFAHAEYRPKNTPNRIARQKRAGEIAVWGLDGIYGNGSDIKKVERLIRNFKNFMDVPIGVHWYEWYGKPIDVDFPEIFPAIDGLKGVVSRLKKSYGDQIFIDAYMNGLLYDSHLPSYKKVYKKDTADNANAKPYKFGRTLRYMCPTSHKWQEIMVASANKIASVLGTDGVYIDMVTATAPKECMNKAHNHPIGGGSYWREGYKQMFAKIHQKIPLGKFIITEGANDFLVDESDVFLTDPFVVEGQVPAFQAVYGGKVQFVGPTTGTSTYKANNEPDSQRFYGRLAQSFNFGVIPGRFYMTIVNNLNNSRKKRAVNYLRRLARLRYKLKAFFSFGEMKKPLVLKGNIPNITFEATKRNKSINRGYVTIPAIQTSTWSDKKSIVISFVNGKVPQVDNESITFSFDFDANSYGLNGDIQIKEITENKDGEYQDITPQFTKIVTLKSYEAKAFIISPK